MRSFFLWVFLGMVVVAFAGCANGLVGQGPSGTVTTKLTVAPGVDETQINYTITGNGIDPLTGTIQVVSNPVTADIAPIPVGSGYTITLATADGICTGSATFDVVASQTTTVAVPIQCSTTPPRGSVSVTGTFLACPTVGSMVVSPTSVAVGSTIQVNASAQNLGQGTLTYAWTATSDGTFANPATAMTTYLCATTGTKTLTITVSNVNCTDSLSVDVTCGQGGGPVCGDGIVSGNEKCDTAIAAGQTGACPTSCNPGTDPCNPVKLQGTGCQAACVATPITVAVCGDGCVTPPETCEPPNTATCDATCHTIVQPTCGNGVVDTGETCDTAIAAGQPGACPTSCAAPNACTTSTLQNAGTCTAACVNTPIVPCCGNGVVETGETCDTAIAAGQPGACPTSCAAPNACTTSTLQNAGTCTAACVKTPIVPCCGNGIVEPPEQCDPPNGTTCDANCQTISQCADITGTWISHLNTTGSITQPIGVITGANIDYILRIYNTKEGGNLVSTIEICELAASASAAGLVTGYSDAVLKTFTVSASIPDFCATVGGPVTMPTFQILSGTKSATFPTGTTSPCSTTPTSTCDAAPDSDGDGKYGITITTTLGALNVSAYAGLAFTIGFNNMVLDTATTIGGTASLTTDGFIWGTSLVIGTGPFKLTPDSNAIPIESFLLPGHGEVLCPQVLTHCTTGPTGVCTP